MNDIPIHGTPDQVLAFCKAMHEMQGELESAPKDAEGKVGKTGDLRKFKFTSYDCLVGHLRPYFARHGFFHFATPGAVSEKGAGSEGGELMLTVASGTVTLAHKDGGMAVAYYSIPVGSARDAGIVHTYCRRYALAGLAGVSSEDDTDAEGHQNPPPQQAQKVRQEPAKQQAKAQPSGDKERAKKGADAIQAHLKKVATNEKVFADYMSQVSAYSQDAHGSKVSDLVAKGWDQKVEDVYRWAVTNIGQLGVVEQAEADYEDLSVELPGHVGR